MQVLEIFKKRFSVRNFTGEPVSPEVLDYILEAGRWSATASNKQARRFVLLKDSDHIREFAAESKMQPFVQEAGALIVGVATNKESYGALADVYIAMAQMETAALEKGIGTIWLGIWDREKTPELLGIPDDCRSVVMLALGHAAEGGEPKEKLPVSELYKGETWE